MWKTIPEFEMYEINEQGQVRNKKTKRIRALSKKYNGYLQVNLRKDGNTYHKLVHRLVLETFNPVEGMEDLVVNHKNEIKDDNRLENLEWCSQKYNVNYGNAQKTKSKSVRQYDLDYNLIATYSSSIEASKATGICSSGIRQAARGERHTAGGYRWEHIPVEKGD